MALSWNEIKSRAVEFSKEWENETREDAEAKSFWDGFFNVFGINRRRLASFEHEVEKRGGGKGFIDLFWPSMLIVEHKSAGKNLDKAYDQAMDYFPGLTEEELPKYILVSDFARIRLYDLETKKHTDFDLKDLQKNVYLFGFIAGYQKQVIKAEDPANIEAAELMASLHDSLAEAGYSGHQLEVFLVRVLFCLFADDTGIFPVKNQFYDYVEWTPKEDGSDFGLHLQGIFDVLNTDIPYRQKNLDERLNAFPYVNGGLFNEHLPVVSFDSKTRKAFLKACEFDWSKISPAIFGSMFQGVMDKKERRALGAHYTSETNILKLIKPLFLDELWAEFENIKHNRAKLQEFHAKIASLKFLDPACGCGNFLLIAYRELRLLELEILKLMYGFGKTVVKFNIQTITKVSPEQFYGIEIGEFAGRIAETAMWLVDHQMNQKASEALGQYFVRLPLNESAHITIGNALTLDWKEIVLPEELSYILGNPPFIGHHLQTAEQKNDLHLVLRGVGSAGVMDYVSAWYVKAAEYIIDSFIECAFVSTNSITQGEQVGILWKFLQSEFKIKINFAHRTFKWGNEASGKAAVYCVIIGFANFDKKEKFIYEYENVKGEPHLVKANNINPYLIDASDILLQNRSKPICDVPAMMYGNKPTDGGNFLFTDEEKKEFLSKEPLAEKFVKPFISAEEFLHNKKRWCLWLCDVQPTDIQKLIYVKDRIERVKNFRAASKAETTRKYLHHSLFRQITQPQSDYILVPRTTSENRIYIPMGFFGKDYIVSDTCMSIPNATLYHFGILESEMHMTWVSYVCGRLESRFRYSKDIVYNNFPWPEDPSIDKTKAIEQAAQVVLDVRKKYMDSGSEAGMTKGASLADLYDPLTMPADLVKAHQNLDRAVDSAYTKRIFKNSAERMEFLFDLYEKYIKIVENK